MKYAKWIFLAVIAAAAFVGCDKEKASIEDTKDATKNAIDIRKDTVDAVAKDAKKQADLNAASEKARIEANKDVLQAQLDADKKKADAIAKAEKARLDAEKK